MIALKLLGIFTAACSLSTPPTDWPSGMTVSRIAVKSELVRRLDEAIKGAAKGVPPAQGVSSGAVPAARGDQRKLGLPGLAPISSDEPPPELIAKIQADLQPAFDAHFAGVRLMRAGKLAEARASLEGSLLRYPTELIAIPLLDVELAQGDYVSAYKVAVPFVRSKWVSQELLLRASMASAGVGEVYSRQRAFVTAYLSNHFWRAEDIEQLPGGESPPTVFAISALAISGEHFIHGEIEEALAFTNEFIGYDSSNPIFCNSAGHEFSEAGQYSKAVRVLQQGIARATGESRVQALAIMGLAQERLKKYGDGNPPPYRLAPKTDSKVVKP